MRFGLFGKLQSKRDFIAFETPRAFLSAWEPWMQGGMAASRMRLGERWQNAFLTAPVWRYWLGADICGTIVTGALMPSMDGVGRYFPLTFAAFAEGDDGPPPPELADNAEWFAAVEDFLFLTLESGRTFEDVTAALTSLPRPSARVAAPADARALAPLPGVVASGEGDFGALFARARLADVRTASAGMSFWWTAGGRDFPPLALAAPRLPDAQLFASMLTGDFSGKALATEEAS